jgi:adenine phosphoribosyltransferase
MKGRGPARKADPRSDFLQLLRSSFHWIYDPYDGDGADVTGWWREPEVLRGLGPALADLVEDADPQVVLAPQSRGTLLGALVAAHLGIGLIEMRKEPEQLSDEDRWIVARTPPDYRDRNLALGIRADLLAPGTRVVFVDDWVDTGGQATAAHRIVEMARAQWCGASVVVDALLDARLRHDLGIRSLLNIRDL